MKNETTRRCGKMLGGIRSILLTDKNNLRTPVFDPRSGTYSAVAFADPRRVASCSFAEGDVSYREEMQAAGGIVRVDHVLEFSTEGLDPGSDALLRKLVASCGGLVAIVTTRGDGRLLVGYSEESRGERPLRLARAAAPETVVLRSRDGAKARSVETVVSG
jgi:hypothetical protein